MATMGAKGSFGTSESSPICAAPTAMDESLSKGSKNAAIVISYATQTELPQHAIVTIPSGDRRRRGAGLAPKIDLTRRNIPGGIDRIFVQHDGIRRACSPTSPCGLSWTNRPRSRFR